MLCLEIIQCIVFAKNETLTITKFTKNSKIPILRQLLNILTKIGIQLEMNGLYFFSQHL